MQAVSKDIVDAIDLETEIRLEIKNIGEDISG